ncbi:Mitochondrial transcription termination factor family protein [Hibiscus syriacus]|uniref:Mitochondrial transcription termination factor family protein n=1 Tax=Hibiscus syriacus TaxID=106335 RepID=A0A6A3CZ06_HIBSY|nr:probable L-type lectin-domain containing receptor kinase S.5 [Hibiscus syriacus]KAE8732512.1 Mitochondrial transcription termination factor family protein [Hibiscus syriacus]
MVLLNGNSIQTMLIIFLTLLHLTAASFKRERAIHFDSFSDSHSSSLTFMGGYSRIQFGALQLTPDTINDAMLSIHHNKSGRIMFNEPFRLWSSNHELASFSSSFVINIFRNGNWTAGHGLAFLIAPNISAMPEFSYGQWLGLTNASTDGSADNQIVAIEFDTLRQPDLELDPDDNHIGLNINSVESKKVASLNDYNITLSPQVGTNYLVWVDYNGTSMVMEVYMARQGESRPTDPILNDTIDLKEHVKQDSFFGFTGSTGDPEIELNCVLQWSLDIDMIPREEEGNGLMIGLAIGVPSVTITILVLAIVWYMRRRRRRKRRNEEGDDRFGSLKWLPGMPREFKYKELKKATNKFDESLKLGEGGFGIVYKGVLNLNNQNQGVQVAVKKFLRDSIKGKDDFLAELAIIHRIRHKNLVRLVGWCYEKGKLLLVYDFMPNGSVDDHLYGKSGQGTLNWSHRYKILTGIASALHYLHNEYDQKVVHRDLKPSNILLDLDYNARLGDFGLARAIENERHSYSELGLSGVPGTMGYVAPECFHTGKATVESDVFGFGAVVLEVVCGKHPGIKIPHQQDLYTLVDWVWMLHRERRLMEAVDERLGGEFDVDEVRRLLLLGLACSHPIATERPQTQDIFQIMNGTLPVPIVPPFKPVFQWPSGPPSSISSIENSLSSLALSSQDSVGMATSRKNSRQP